MNLRNICHISPNLKTFHKAICLRPVSYSFFSQDFSSGNIFSTKPVKLSYSEFLPDEISNSTPVVILHGFLGAKQNWRGLGKAIAKKSGRKVFALDARNHGDSPHSDNFNYNVMCEDVKHFLNSKAIQQAVLVGHSMGGRTAMKLALTEKKIVNKLVIIDVSPTKMPESSSIFIPSYMVAMKEAIVSVHDMGIVQARKLIDEHLSKTIPEVAIRQFLLTNLVEKDKKITWKANIDVLHKTFQAEICEFSHFTGCFMQETLFICGGESPYVKEEDHPLIKQIFPKAEFVVVPGAGHWVHSEKPAEFLEAICNFL